MNLTPSRVVMLLVLVLLECWLLFAAFMSYHIDKPGRGSAWYDWHRHPSVETEAAWRAEERKRRIEQAVAYWAIWSMIAAAGVGIYYVTKKPKQAS